jgi:hypothetical protein
MRATIISTLLWILSIVLAFQIPASSPLIWLPDSLLLAGFVPLLLIWKKWWLTLLFGLFNSFIGFFLLILTYLESDKFVGNVLAMKEHLVSMHSPWAWIICGLLCVVWGLIGLVVMIVRMVKKKNNRLAK